MENDKNFKPQIKNGIPEVSVDQVYQQLSNNQSSSVRLIDVRRPEEFNGELGHIAGAQLITLGDQLTESLQHGDRLSKIIFICRSGARSATATEESLRLGYKNTVNMVGGMLAWNERKYPTEKSEVKK